MNEVTVVSGIAANRTQLLVKSCPFSEISIQCRPRESAVVLHTSTARYNSTASTRVSPMWHARTLEFPVSKPTPATWTRVPPPTGPWIGLSDETTGGKKVEK